MARLTPYAYRSGTTLLHRTGAGWKLLTLLALSVASFAFGLPGLLCSAASIVAAAAAARLSPRRLLAGIGPLLFVTLFVVALRALVLPSDGAWLAIDYMGLREGIFFALSVLIAFSGGSILFATTTTAELREAVATAEEAVTTPLVRALRKSRRAWCRNAAAALERSTLSLVIALTLGFLPRVFEIWEAAEEARAARCGKKGLRGTAAMLPLVIERLMEMAAETARAMEGRGATLGREKTENLVI